MSKYSVDELIEGIRAADRMMLGRAITLIESTREADRRDAEVLVQECLPLSGNSFRIGVTGVPGVGKSTLIDVLGMRLIEHGHRVAVLAVDPTSGISGGSILGDKTRMQNLAAHEDGFVRPSPSGGRSGGVAQRTREAILVCESAGFDRVFVETVGVGQAEIAVHSMVDFFLLLALAGAGDELQGIKRGIVEMADMVAITKADGANKAAAEEARIQFRHALKLFPPTEHGWEPCVRACSATSGEGIGELLSTFSEFEEATRSSGHFERRRREQGRYWLRETLDQRVRELINTEAGDALRRYEEKVVRGEMSASSAAEAVLEAFRRSGGR